LTIFLPCGSSYRSFFFEPRSRTSCFLWQNRLPSAPCAHSAAVRPSVVRPCQRPGRELPACYALMSYPPCKTTPTAPPLAAQPLGRWSRRSPMRVCSGEAPSSYPFISLLSIPSMLCVSTRRGWSMASERPWQPARQLVVRR
jgi:hypothetical protein